MSACKMISLGSVFLLLSFSTTPIQSRASWIKFPFPKLPVLKLPQATKPPPPTKAPPAFSPVKDSKYCDESKITKILSDEGRKKRAINKWPYDCTWPSIIKHHGHYQFMYDIYSCCKECDFPAYTTCIKNHGSPNWRCPSDSIHCIVGCIKKYGPGTIKVPVSKRKGGFGSSIKTSGIHTLGNKNQFIERPKKLKCEKVEKLPNGKTCVRRLCVPLKT